MRPASPGALATVARRTAARLELVDLFPVGAGDLRGVQPHQARVGAHHVRRVAARGHAGEIALLDGAQDIRADAQLAGGRGQIESFALAGHGQAPRPNDVCLATMVSSVFSVGRCGAVPFRPIRQRPRRPSVFPVPFGRRAPRAGGFRWPGPRCPFLPLTIIRPLRAYPDLQRR